MAMTKEVDPYELALKEYNALNLSSMPQITIWSSDFHISPIADLKYLLKDFNVRFLDKSLSGHCHLTNTCAKDLHVITQFNGIRLSPCPSKLRREFYEHYRRDKEFMAADAILCTHAISLCELFMPFQKPLILIASTRYEIGRHDRVSWERWNGNLERIAKKAENTIAANNAYDRAYLTYFTSLPMNQTLLLPSYCEYVNTIYTPDLSKPFLLTPARGVNEWVARSLRTALSEYNANKKASEPPLVISPVREIYPLHFEYSELSRHPGMVVLPYQVSVMSLFEAYRMAIPLFVPSLRLLVQWHLDHRILSERTWDNVFGSPRSQSILAKHWLSSSPMQSDPNDEFSEGALTEWLALSDFYQWPHIHVFDSFQELFEQLQTVDLLATSMAMRRYNDQVKRQLQSDWKAILKKIIDFRESKRSGLQLRGVVEEELPLDVNDALFRSYGIRLRDDDCHRQEEVEEMIALNRSHSRS